MAVASSASVSQITAVSTCSFVRSSPRVKSTVVSFGIQKFSYGCSSSRFLASETPFSFVVLKTGGKPGTRIVHAQGQNYQQNEDLPTTKSTKVKKPFVRPIKHGSHQKRMKRRELRQLPPKPLKAPAKGLLVEKLIPLAHSVYKTYLVVLDGVSRLVKHLPVKACRKPKTKGKKGGRAYEDEDDLDAAIEGLDGPSPSVETAVGDANEAIDVSAARRTIRRKVEQRKGRLIC